MVAMTTTMPPPPVERASAPRRPVAAQVGEMRTMLLAVGGVILASVLAATVGWLVYDSASGPAGDVQASTVEFAIHMPTVLTVGRHTIGLTNDGKAPHELVIVRTDLPANRLPLNADGDVNEDSPLLTSVADSGDALNPGKSKSFRTDNLTRGHYVAICNLAGHYGLGMRVDVTVK
jgi:uncharacterized cupredoxin-like copper-binding protein